MSMPVYCLEMISTQDWKDIRYRDYTTSVRKSEAFGKIPEIKFTDSHHRIIAVVTMVGNGKTRKDKINILRAYVSKHLMATA